MNNTNDTAVIPKNQEIWRRVQPSLSDGKVVYEATAGQKTWLLGQGFERLEIPSEEMEIIIGAFRDLISLNTQNIFATPRGMKEQEERKHRGLQDLVALELKRAAQQTCSHVHGVTEGPADNGDSHCVYVHEEGGPGYLLCQACTGKIRRGEKPETGFDPDAVYDSVLFDELFKNLMATEGRRAAVVPCDPRGPLYGDSARAQSGGA
jgi:hypothetical protein